MTICRITDILLRFREIFHESYSENFTSVLVII